MTDLPAPPQYVACGSDEEYPAACARCGKSAKRTGEPTPSGESIMVRCEAGHETTGMPDFNHPIYAERHPAYFALRALRTT